MHHDQPPTRVSRHVGEARAKCSIANGPRCPALSATWLRRGDVELLRVDRDFNGRVLERILRVLSTAECGVRAPAHERATPTATARRMAIRLLVGEWLHDSLFKSF